MISNNRQSHGLLGNVQQIEDVSNKQSMMQIDSESKENSPNNNEHAKNSDAGQSPKNDKLHICPFDDCKKPYKQRSSLNAHLVNHEQQSNYEIILSFGCSIDNCDARFETLKLQNQHETAYHSSRRETLTPEQKCPKCIVFRGSINAGVLKKGAFKHGSFRKVFCSLKAKTCGFTQKIKQPGHIYVYTQKKK